MSEARHDFSDRFPHLYAQPTFSDACLYLSRLEWLAREKDDAGYFTDFMLLPVLESWIDKNGKQALVYAEMGKPFSSADLHFPAPSPETMAAAVHAGMKTVDHSTGKEVLTKQWRALHGWAWLLPLAVQ